MLDIRCWVLEGVPRAPVRTCALRPGHPRKDRRIAPHRPPRRRPHAAHVPPGLCGAPARSQAQLPRRLDYRAPVHTPPARSSQAAAHQHHLRRGLHGQRRRPQRHRAGGALGARRRPRGPLPRAGPEHRERGPRPRQPRAARRADGDGPR
eukprot:6553917-Prymnesium_polylepis.1